MPNNCLTPCAVDIRAASGGYVLTAVICGVRMWWDGAQWTCHGVVGHLSLLGSPGYPMLYESARQASQELSGAMATKAAAADQLTD